MAKVLVAGAAGFIGSHLVDRLLADGAIVHGMDDLCTGAYANLAQALDNPRFTFWNADVTRELWPDRVQDPGAFDVIYHLASPASPLLYLKMPFETLRAGSVGTENLLVRAGNDRATFVLASTSEVYGDPLVHPQVESYWGHANPVGPRSVYDEAKRFAETLTMAHHRYRGVNTRIARIFNTYGPRMRLDDGRVIPAFCGAALRGEPIPIYGDGRHTRSFCYVDDLVDGLVRLAKSDLVEPCNLGNPVEISMLELADKVRAVAGRDVPLVHHALPEDDPRKRRPDITRARTVLGWEPRVSFDDGLRRTIDAFRAA